MFNSRLKGQVIVMILCKITNYGRIISTNIQWVHYVYLAIPDKLRRIEEFPHHGCSYSNQDQDPDQQVGDPFFRDRLQKYKALITPLSPPPRPLFI